MIEAPVTILAILLTVLAILFSIARHPTWSRIYRVIPLLVFAYFVPMGLSNTGIIPLESPLYEFIKNWLLPASLLLLTLSVDIPAILRLGNKLLLLFLSGTAGIVLGGPLAYLLCGWLISEELGDQAWKGLAALSGSWIGGGANFIAIGESVGAGSSTISLMVVVDVAIAGIWMAVLFYFAGREREMDENVGADRRALEELRRKVEKNQSEVARPTTLSDLLLIAALAIGGTAAAARLGALLPEIGEIISGFTWVVILVTAFGVSMSFTPLRRLEGVGASAVGSVFLYLLVATIGAQGSFRALLDAPALVLLGGIWMAIHAVLLLVIRYQLRAPIFFLAVGSQANVGGAASAPIVAAAFHPALAPVGVLLAVAGYVLGTYAGLLCAFLLQWVHWLVYA